jgi:hypothetical protein
MVLRILRILTLEILIFMESFGSGAARQHERRWKHCPPRRDAWADPRRGARYARPARRPRGHVAAGEAPCKCLRACRRNALDADDPRAVLVELVARGGGGADRPQDAARSPLRPKASWPCSSTSGAGRPVTFETLKG